MTTASDHYDRLLAEHYTWMLGGDIAALASEQARSLGGWGVRPGPAGTLAVDLGCGPGPQSLALAELGFSPVLAVDANRALLDELAHHARDAVRPLHADIRGVLPEHTHPGSLGAVVCMGDTLTHLPRAQDVTELIADAAVALAEGGRLVLAHRDLTAPLTGDARFLPVRATRDRIMTCFLEYGDETVTVHDLIHTRTGDTWRLRTGSYPKLRLGSAWVAAQCRAAGLRVTHDAPGPRGLHVISAVKDTGTDARQRRTGP
ncbi:SAM-dependent methyltransferase [Streptomyces sp. 13-12-16]|uniref:class I SAM-dependent methyltransferase n=1 Tax=Streptomyces sp. 13-12-16 TaxID=1570823 RepID=UPI000A1EDC11|nr:class I SAM-dependent methyltransferase [Streptomyces sp. 13-12-16]OSP41737.1 SAM-dependent methyltransferase [Streptomyces sp. 13-12-16]